MPTWPGWPFFRGTGPFRERENPRRTAVAGHLFSVRCQDAVRPVRG